MERDNTQVEMVHVVGPVDQQAAPDHDGQDRDVHPVHPADDSWVFRLQAVHGVLLRTQRCIRSSLLCHGLPTVAPGSPPVGQEARSGDRATTERAYLDSNWAMVGLVR